MVGLAAGSVFGSEHKGQYIGLRDLETQMKADFILKKKIILH